VGRRQEFDEKLDRSQEPLYLLYAVQRWLQLVLNLVVTGLSVTVTGIAVARRGSTSVSAIGLALLNMTTLGETMTLLITSWTSLETSLGAIARIEAFEEDTPIEKPATSPVQVSAAWPEHGAILFNNISAHYSPSQANWGLQNISLDIKAGEKIAVCGRSGSGKSTFLLALLALIETPEGSITVDGIDISQVERATLRSRFHVIAQDPFIQGETVRDALDPDHSFTDGAISEVLLECAVLDRVSAAGGLAVALADTILSPGESQLFSLARTILQASLHLEAGGIVLLDEATSSVDVTTERKIMKLVTERLQGKTVVSVLHRLEAALGFDRILVLDAGRVVAFGKVDEVVGGCELFASFRGRGKVVDIRRSFV